MKVFARLVFVFCVAVGIAFPIHAQTSTTVSAAPTAISSPTRTTTRTVSAIIAAVNAPARTISLRLVPDGALTAPTEILVALQDATCRPLKNNRTATLADFAAGEQVVARLTWRVSPERLVVLRDLYDATSYAERQRQGKEICVGVVDAFSATEVSVRRPDGIQIAFRVTDKTRLVKQDVPAFLASFPVGAPVAVKPRRLPSGDLQASIVGANAREVSWAYRDTLTTWIGVVSSIQGDDRTGAVISLKREDGAQRRFLLPVGGRFKQGRTLLPWRLLPGATVSVHLIKGADPSGMRTADEIKIASRRTPKITDDIDTAEEP